VTEVPPGAGPVDRILPGSHIREWRIDRFIARGAYGQVFEGRRSSWVVGEPSRALKVFDPILSSGARSSLMSEFDVLRRVRHPHLLRGDDAFDVEEGPLRGCVVFVMERADTDLAGELARRGRIPAVEVARIGAHVASGLAALHELDRLHGDVKPANILLVDDEWKLGDFGVTAALHGSYALAAGATLDYRPPELSAAEVGIRLHRSADVWSLGVALWGAATGRHPFVGADPQLRYAAVLRGDRLPAPELDPVLGELIDRRCLATKPRDRATAAELVDLLTALAARLELPPPPPPPSRPSQPPPPVPTSATAPAAPTDPAPAPGLAALTAPPATAPFAPTAAAPAPPAPIAPTSLAALPTDAAAPTAAGGATRAPTKRKRAGSGGVPARTSRSNGVLWPRPGLEMVIAAVVAGAVVEAVSQLSGLLPFSLNGRRISYLVAACALLALAMVAAVRRGLLPDLRSRALAAISAAVVVVAATAWLFR